MQKYKTNWVTCGEGAETEFQLFEDLVENEQENEQIDCWGNTSIVQGVFVIEYQSEHSKLQRVPITFVNVYQTYRFLEQHCATYDRYANTHTLRVKQVA